MEVFGLVALADCAPLDVVAHHARRLQVVERGAESMEGLLDTLVPGAVSCGENVGPERGRRWNEDAPAMEDELVH